MVVRPILRWAGSKRRLVPRLLRCVPAKFGTYYEPFLGSACLFFALQPPHAVLSDLLDNLMSTYRTLRQHPSAIGRAVLSMPTSANYYYAMRAKNSAKMRPIEAAARFIYLNRNCFNGVYRTNRSGRFNVPRGIRTGKSPSLDEFASAARALRTAELRVGDFERCLADVRPGDFVYLDPPYSSSTRRPSGEYSYDCFCPARDTDRLLKLLHDADRSGVTLLLSYNDSMAIRVALRGWSFRTVATRRQVAGDPRNRVAEPDIIASNRALPADL